MSEFLPNSCLLGIHLTIFTHSGPQMVYHYPPSVVDHLTAKQRQNKKNSTAVDGKKGKEHAPNDFGRKTSVGGLITSQSLTSNDYRFQGEENTSSPGSRFKGLPDWTKKEEIKGSLNSDVESDLESSSSGLSDSELSTDYADFSSDSSSAGGSLDEEGCYLNTSELGGISDHPNELKNKSTMPTNIEGSLKSETSQSLRPLKPKSSQISASKLLDIVGTDGNIRRASHASKMSSFTASHDPNEDFEGPSQSDLEISQAFEKDKIDFDEQHFAEENFQELNKVFGFDTEFVAEFCSPEREMCNTRFEFTTDNICFLGLPIHVDAGGKWRRSRRRKHSSKSKRSNSTGTKGSKRGNTSKRSNSQDEPEMDSSVSNADAQRENKISEGTDNTEAVKADDLQKSMDMFHICFVMNPPLVEYNERVDDMFHYVVARLSLLLRYSQAKSNYVSRQCNLILREKERVLKNSRTYKSIKGTANKAKYLYQRILVISSLARALTTCVDKLQRNEIACLEIDEDKVISLQIPIQNEFRVLPNFKLHPVLRGSFLTSILNSRFLEASPAREGDEHMIEEKEDSDVDDDLLHYALLLLDEPANIIKDLETLSSEDDIGNMVLTHLIRQIQPTVALGSYQSLINELLGSSNESSMALGMQNSFQTSMLRSCALHLLYRRHARVIIPISSKSTYILSPLAPIRGYSKNDFRVSDESHAMERPLIYQYQEIFKKRFPSLPSLPSFLNLLSTKQPKPFGSIIPSKEHKPIYLGALTWLIRYGYATQLLSFVCIRVDKQIKMAVEEDLEKETPRVKKDTANRDHDHDTVDNFSKGKDFRHQLVPQSQLYQHDEDVENYAYDDPNMEKDYTIILEPERATAIEKRWIFKCIQDQPGETQILFNKMLKYFNGRTPMELVVIREGISRHEVRRILNVLSRYLVEFHHW